MVRRRCARAPTASFRFRNPALRRPASTSLGLSGHEAERLANQRAQLVVIHLGQLDSNPAARADIRGPEVDIGRLLDQSGLHTGSGWDPHGYVSVAVVIIDKHGKDALRSEKCRRAMRR